MTSSTYRTTYTRAATLSTSTLTKSVVRTVSADGPSARGCFGCRGGLIARGRPSPSAVSRRSAVWARGTVARVECGGAAPGRTAIQRKPGGSRGGVRCHPGACGRAVGRAAAADSSAGSAAGTSGAGAPSAPRGSGGTIRVAVRARSTECRTGSTPGSPDQRSAGDAGRGTRLAGAQRRRDRPFERLGNRRGLRLSTVSTGLSTTVVGVPTPSIQPQPGQPGSQLWITTG